jgi:hypothetical protein
MNLNYVLSICLFTSIRFLIIKMKLSEDLQHKAHNTSPLSFEAFDYNQILNLSLYNLPKSRLETKLDFIKFSFLLLIIPESNIRATIDKSRITEPFWNAIRQLREFQYTFERFTDKDLLNIYKYISFFGVIKEYKLDYVCKSFFFLIENGIITNDTNLAEIGRFLYKYLKKITRKNANQSAIRGISNINLLYFYYKHDDSNSRERLNDNMFFEKLPNFEKSLSKMKLDSNNK